MVRTYRKKPIKPDNVLEQLLDLDCGAEHYGIEKVRLGMLARPGESDYKH